MTRRRPLDTDLPQHIVDAIRKAWPDGVVDMPDNSDDAPLWETYPRLKPGLSHIPGCRVLYEREPNLVPNWGQGSDEDQESPDWDEGSRSYYLFFVCPKGERFEFETDILEPDEDGIEQRFPGQGWIGYTVGISVIAPFAVVVPDQMEVFDNGSRSEPDVEPHSFSLDGGRLDLESQFRETVDETGLLILRKLRARIVRVLKESGIAVIPEADLDRVVPWLRAGEEVFAGQAGESITVRQAFFFRGL